MKAIFVKKNDMVVVRSGKDKGKVGKVLKVLPEEGRVIVEKVHFIKEFIRPDRSKNIQGGIMEKEAPFPASNVLLYCRDCGRGVRVRQKIMEDKSRVRVCVKCESSFEKAK
ncbi:MAG: 50S ribosomal protein L24 [Candidatus Aminicenantales bacterium]